MVVYECKLLIEYRPDEWLMEILHLLANADLTTFVVGKNSMKVPVALNSGRCHLINNRPDLILY